MDIATAPRPRRGAPADPAQPSLPLDVLAFDDEADRPVPLALTARALRAVAPATVPVLRVVEGGAAAGSPTVLGDADDPADTRPARARALWRAGLTADDIAERLGVDPLLARAWTQDVPPPRRRRTAGRRPRTAEPSLPSATHPSTLRRREVHADEPDPALRRAARDEAWDRLGHDPAFAATVGTLAASVAYDGLGATLVTTRLALAASTVACLSREADLDGASVRVVLRVGPGTAADRARHEWAAALGIGLDRVATARWAGAPQATAVEGTVRVTDPAVVARIAGWCDALLGAPLATRRDGSA